MKKIIFLSQKFIQIILIVVLLLNLISLALPEKASAASASFYLAPSSGSANVGDTISASVMISTDSAINAGEASVTFSSDVLEYQSVSTGGSIFSFWTSGPSGGSTSVSFGGGLPSPGYSGGAGKVLTITFRAANTGTGSVNINGSKILANDGNGTNILSGSSGGSFDVVPSGSSPTNPASTTRSLVVNTKSDTHPDQNKWYNNKNVFLSWSARDATSYLIAFDRSSNTSPSSSITSTSKKYDNSADGVWYFHIKALGIAGAGPIVHFKVQIDTAPPDAFSINVAQEGGATNPTPKVSFEAKDSTSGIDRYEGRIDNGDSFAIASEDKLPKQHPGNHSITVKAYDKAGNVRESKASYKIVGIPAPNAKVCSKTVGLLEPVYIEGTADKGDTIVIYLNGKEVDRFLAEDKKIDAKQARCLDNVTYASDNEKIIWRYIYQQLLYPGEHSFQFMRINKDGMESELTQAFKVSVVASVIKVGNYTFPTKYVLIPLILTILALSAVIFYLLRKMRHLAVRGGAAIGLVLSKVKNIFIKTEKEIDKDIDKSIPDYELSRSSVLDAKRKLKDEIREEIEKGEEEITGK